MHREGTETLNYYQTSDRLGELKPDNLSSGCQDEMKVAAVENPTNPGRRFLFFLRLRRSCVFARQNRQATQAIKL